MARSPAPGKSRTARRGRYHHGNLRQALIAASLKIMAESGPEQVTVREAAKRAGVSSGAPFRHFSTRTALMTAVAEEAMRRFRAAIDAALAAAADDPLARFHAMGAAYLRWALDNPMHFQAISARRLIDFDGSAALRGDNAEVRGVMESLLVSAAERGRLASSDLAHLQLAARALVYGLARMAVDGHFAQWGRADETTEESMARTLALFVELIGGGQAQRRRSVPTIPAGKK